MVPRNSVLIQSLYTLIRYHNEGASGLEPIINFVFHASERGVRQIAEPANSVLWAYLYSNQLTYNTFFVLNTIRESSLTCPPWPHTISMLCPPTWTDTFIVLVWYCRCRGPKWTTTAFERKKVWLRGRCHSYYNTSEEELWRIQHAKRLEGDRIFSERCGSSKNKEYDIPGTVFSIYCGWNVTTVVVSTAV